ncbi:MAG: hypothetical protein PHG66_00500 [Candidatus Colwellbacteria bacterium]|nr:hypothetical protein [Candidatus Colwellbacteria bacterium]
MSSGTITESSSSDKKKSVLLSSIGGDDVLSFIRESTFVEETSTIKSISIMNKVEEKLREIEKDIVPVNKSFSVFGWATKAFTRKERIYPELLDITTKREMKDFLNTNRYTYTPDINRLRDYRFVQPELASTIVSTLKDSNDKIEFFRRSFNRAVKADNDQYAEEKKINDLIQKGDTKILMKSSAIFVNKKTRTLRKFFNDVGNSVLYNQNSSALSYFNNVNSMYKFFHFTMGGVVYKSAKTWVVSATITSMGLSGGSAILGSLPIYMMFSAYDTYQNIKEDSGETTWDNIMYTLWKSPLIGCMDCVKDMAATHLSLGRGFVVSASLVFDVTMMFIDPRLSKHRADDLAKTYGQGMDRETIKNLMEPTKEALTISRILSKVMLPLDWIANLPECVFTTIYTKISSVPIGPLKYLNEGPLKYLNPVTIPLAIVKRVANTCNIVWKFGVYAIPGIFCMVACYNSFINVMPYFREFFSLFINKDMSETGYGLPSKETLISMVDRLTEVTPLSWDKIHQTIIKNISVFGGMETVLVTMLNYIKMTTKDLSAYEFAKKILLNLYQDKKIAKFFLGIPVNWMTSKTTNFLKSHTQMYLSVIAPTLLAMYSGRSGQITSLDQYLDLAKTSIVYGVIGFGAGTVLLNSLWDNMLNHAKDPKTVEKYREIDTKAGKMSGRWLSKRAAKNILYTYHYLSSNLIVEWIDQSVNRMKNKVAGGMIEWVEVNYGRKSFIYDSNFTWLSNRLVMDEYFSQAMSSSMIDVLSNVDTIMTLESESNSYKGVKLDKEKIRKVIDERKEMDIRNRAIEIANQKLFNDEKGDLFDNKEEIRLKLVSLNSKMSKVNPVGELLEKQRELILQRVTMENNLRIASKALDDVVNKIELSQSKVSQIDFIQKYYEKNERLWDNPTTEMVNENAKMQTASIVINKFIPFINRADPTALAALESDARTQYNIVHNRMKEYTENIAILEASSKNILANLPDNASEKLENLNTMYTDVVQRFNKDEGLHDHIEYMQAINEIVIRQQSLEMALGGSDIDSFYQSNKRLSSIKKTQDLFLKDIPTTRYLVDPSIIEKVKTGEGGYGSLDPEIDRLLEEYRLTGEKKVVVESSESRGWLSGIYDKFENYTVEQIRKGMRNIVGYGMTKKREGIRRLQELKTMEESLKENNPRDIKGLQEIQNLRDQELRTLSTVDTLVTSEIKHIQVLVPEMKPVTEEDKRFVQAFSSLKKSVGFERVKEIDRQIDFDIGIDTTTDYDYDIIYEKAFGDDSSFPSSYSGEELQEIQSFDKVINLMTGVKVLSDAFGLVQYDCPDPPQSSCLNRNAFVTSIPEEVIKEIDSITDDIYQKISNLGIEGTTQDKKTIIANNLMLMWITPEYRSRLSKFEMSSKSVNLLHTVMKQSSTVMNSGRMFDEHLKGKDLDWSNPHVLYLLSKKTYHMDYITGILLRSNFKEYLKRESELLTKKDSLFEEETKQYEKLHQMTEDYNKNNGNVFTDIKARGEPTVTETWSSTISNYVANMVGSIFGSIGLGGITQGIDWIRVQINKSRDGREKNTIKEQYLSKLEEVDNLIVKDSIRTQVDTWYSAAERVDAITGKIKYEKNLMNLNYQTEDKSLRYVQRTLEGSDMSGVLSPSEDEILHMFFADDESGLKSKYVRDSGITFPNRVLEIERAVRIIGEIK